MIGDQLNIDDIASWIQSRLTLILTLLHTHYTELVERNLVTYKLSILFLFLLIKKTSAVNLGENFCRYMTQHCVM